MKSLVIALIFVLIPAISGFCHPPSDIAIKVSGATVEITVMHNVLKSLKITTSTIS